jgi:hypothetical protein
MAYARARSTTAELHTGTIDGKYKQVIKDRGGEPEVATGEARRSLSIGKYGVVEAARKESPMCLEFTSNYTSETPHPEGLAG